MDKQNALITNISIMTVFNLNNIDKIHVTKEWSYVSIRKWLQNAKTQSGEDLLHSVMIGIVDKETYILFNKGDYNEVH